MVIDGWWEVADKRGMAVAEDKLKIYTQEREVAVERLSRVRTEGEELEATIQRLDIKIETIQELIGQPMAFALDASKVPPTVKDAVQQFIAAIPGKSFTREDVITFIRANYPSLKFTNRAVEKPLTTLMQNGEIVMVRRGHGEVPTVYCVKAKL